MKERNDTNTAARTETGGEPRLSEVAQKDGLNGRMRNALLNYIERWGNVKPSQVEQKKFLLMPNCGSKTWQDFELERDRYGLDTERAGEEDTNGDSGVEPGEKYREQSTPTPPPTPEEHEHANRKASHILENASAAGTERVTRDNLPEVVGRIWDFLQSTGWAEGRHGKTTDEFDRRLERLEKKIDNIERLLSPDRPVMEKTTVLRLLKLRPRQLGELERTGILMSHREGRGSVFYEDDVMRFYASGVWRKVKEEAEEEKIAQSSPAGSGSPATVPTAVAREIAPPPKVSAAIPATGRRRVDIYGAAEVLGCSPEAVRLLFKSGLPCHRDGVWLYFLTDELREWAEKSKI